MIEFLSGVGVGLLPFIVILCMAIDRARKTTADPQNSIQHVQEHVVAITKNQNGKTHAH